MSEPKTLQITMIGAGHKAISGLGWIMRHTIRVRVSTGPRKHAHRMLSLTSHTIILLLPAIVIYRHTDLTLILHPCLYVFSLSFLSPSSSSMTCSRPPSPRALHSGPTNQEWRTQHGTTRALWSVTQFHAVSDRYTVDSRAITHT